ncbi:MAG TPA: hypothetical protein VMZ90_03790, partial [Vicinamibacterales bacterium]|nr:hypothetical protein [Vicinamibacterales bacterium]
RLTAVHLNEEEQHVHDNERVRDYRCGFSGGIIVADWEHEASGTTRIRPAMLEVVQNSTVPSADPAQIRAQGVSG